MADENRDVGHLALILDLAAMIDRRLAGLNVERFSDDIDEVDLTTFRLTHIGEASRKLSDDGKGSHSEIPWKRVYDYAQPDQP